MRVLGHKSVDWKGCSVNGANDDRVKVFWPGRLQRSEEAKVVHKYFCVVTQFEMLVLSLNRYASAGWHPVGDVFKV